MFEIWLLGGSYVIELDWFREDCCGDGAMGIPLRFVITDRVGGSLLTGG